ncbi:putative beta-xylosidase [Madurella mycetomatis]|uniref:Beta-xylosidase n=1 Tax=Madurella mycetomatis TaxID=100816 RepID=A0A175VPM5_9PEZI|nr:putative beta-xylosidase [Madurella mycetomatis]
MWLPLFLLLTRFLPPADSATTLTNPVIWQDHPDLDVFRIGSVFYYSSSTFAYSPGAPLLRSYDLANWEPISHSVPTLNFGPEYDLPGSPRPQRAYVRGIWASTLRYRPSTDTFYWLGCISSGRTYVWTASGTDAAANDGEVPSEKWNWTPRPAINACYYDAGLLVDDDPSETMYVAYGNREIRVAQLTVLPNGDLAEVRSQLVYTHGTTIEGARMYKINGRYYIFVTRPADSEYVLRSDSGPFGPYTIRPLVERPAGPLTNAGFAHQGGVVDTPDGRWYYVAFLDAVVMDSSGRWGMEYPVPVNTSKTVAGSMGEVTEEFRGERPGHGWEWNHNPDGEKWAMAGDGLVLRTASVTGDLFAARNTLTHRIHGPKSRGTFRVDVSKMSDGDRAGAVLFRDRAAYIGVHKTGNTWSIVMVNDLNLAEGTWQTTSTGRVAATGPSTGGGEIWLRIEADITPAFGTNQERRATFSYSLDGTAFTNLGPAFGMSNSWRYFTGYRYGVFNFATKALGGEVLVKSFAMELIQ